MSPIGLIRVEVFGTAIVVDEDRGVASEYIVGVGLGSSADIRATLVQLRLPAHLHPPYWTIHSLLSVLTSTVTSTPAHVSDRRRQASPTGAPREARASHPEVGRAPRGYVAAPPGSRARRAATATALRAALEPGDPCGPNGRHRGQADRLPTPNARTTGNPPSAPTRLPAQS